MSPPEFAVRRPVTVIVSTVAVALFGWLSLRHLPIELLPDLSYPTLTVQTEYRDAAPVSVEQFVTRPMEESVGVIPGVRRLRSVSRAGLSEVVLEFGWDEPMDFAAMEVREKMGLAEIPDEASRPRVLRFDPSLDPIVRLAFGGDRPLDDMRQLADRWLKPRLEAVSGVAAAKVRGGLDPEVVVEADADRLAALGLSLDDLAGALRQDNVNQPGGTLKDWGSVYLVRTLHEFDNLEQLRRTVVRDGPAGRVRVGDVAEVRRGHRDRDEMTRSGGAETVEIALHREGSANTIRAAAAIREEVELLRGEMAADLSLEILSDQSSYISEAIGQVGWAAVWGGILAILVLYFFLRDPAPTSIVALTIPISVMATFLPMFKSGVTLNIMSLGGLALGVGMLVDNSIVVLEAIDRHTRQGASRSEAAKAGGREVSGAVTAATLTTVAVFLPIVFVRGIAGQLFYDLAVTVCLALIASLAVSLTLIPTLASFEPREVRRIEPSVALTAALGADAEPRRPFTVRLGRLVVPPIGSGCGVVSRVVSVIALPFRLAVRLLLVLAWVVLVSVRLVLLGAAALVWSVWRVVSGTFEIATWPVTRAFDALRRAYPPGLVRALRVRWALLAVSAALFAGAVALVPMLGSDLVPDLSQGEFAFRLRLPEGSTLESTGEVVARAEANLVDDPRFDRVFSVVGSLPSTASGRQTLGENLAQIDFVLHDGVNEQAAITRVRQVLSKLPRTEAELVRPSVLSMQPPIEVDLFSDDLEALHRAAATTVTLLAGLDGVEDVATTSEPGSPEVVVVPDRERAASAGIDAERLSTALRGQIGGLIVGEFREGEDRIDIRLRAAESFRDRASGVENLRIRVDNGESLPLSAVADVKIDMGPAAIHRLGGSRAARVTAEVTSPDLGRLLDTVKAEVAATPFPPSVTAEMAGQDEELKVSFDSLRLALGLAVFMVYVVMAVQFESFRYPFVILLSVPLGLVGVVAALLLTGTSVNVLVLIGAVMLAGIVVNNAIVLVDAVNRRRRSGHATDEAIVGAGRERLRPILMTTATTVLGLLPMAIGLGAGDELRRPMAITVIGGLTAATLLTLVVVPCLYRTMTPAGGAPVEARLSAPAEGGAR